MPRPDLTSLLPPVAFTMLSRWIAPHIPPKLLHSHEKISDADLFTVEVIRKIYAQIARALLSDPRECL